MPPADSEEAEEKRSRRRGIYWQRLRTRSLAVRGGENGVETHFGIEKGGERESEEGEEEGGRRRDVTLIDEPFSVFSPIRRGEGRGSEGAARGAGGIRDVLPFFPGY